jgi:hypothetical protein
MLSNLSLPFRGGIAQIIVQISFLNYIWNRLAKSRIGIV